MPTPEESTISSEQQIKFEMDNFLDLDGSRIPRGKPMQEHIDGMFKAIFQKKNELALWDILLEIQQQPKDWWNSEQEELR